MGLLMAVIAVGVIVRWKDTPVQWLLGMLAPVLIGSVVLAVIATFLVGDFNWAVLAVCLLSAWVVLAGVRDILEKNPSQRPCSKGCRALTRR